jgi:hypothetical protein
LLVDLDGFPSAHGLRSVRGEILAASVSQRVRLQRRLEPLGVDGLTLVEVAGVDVRMGRPVPVGERFALRFCGVVDPDSVTAAAVPLFPSQDGLQLEPLHPVVRWQVVGARTLVEVDLERARGPLQLQTRRMGLRALDGRGPEPLLALDLVPSVQE